MAQARGPAVVAEFGQRYEAGHRRRDAAIIAAASGEQPRAPRCAQLVPLQRIGSAFGLARIQATVSQGQRLPGGLCVVHAAFGPLAESEPALRFLEPAIER